MGKWLSDLASSLSSRLWTHLVDWLPRIFAATLVIVAFWLVWKVFLRLLTQALNRWSTDATLSSFIVGTTRAVVVIVASVSVLSQLGIDTASLIASLGIAGLTLGFAAKDTLSNIIAGLFIFWDRPFVIGDLVEVDGHYGRVKEITLRSTRVVTPDGKMLAIPNTTVVNTTVASYTNFPHLRLDVEVTVGLQEDIERIRTLLLAIIDGDPRYLTEPAPVVVITALGDFNRTLEMRAWIDDEKSHVHTRHELRERIYDTLNDAGVDMPLETLQLAPLHLENSPLSAA